MASGFKIGTTSGGVTSLDLLTTAVVEPQPEYLKYRNIRKLGNAKFRGYGLPAVVWTFPMLEVAQVTQLLSFESDEPIYIRSLKADDTWGLFQVLMNIIDPRYDGEHMAGFRGYRSKLVIEFTVLDEATI